MEYIYTVDELVKKLGNDIKLLRLLKNITREMLCESAGVSMNALRHLEGGAGSTINTLIPILIQLNKLDWLKSLAPQITINPLHKKKIRKRASIPRKIRNNIHELEYKKPLLKKYGLTIDVYVKMHQAQSGRCGNTGCNTILDLTNKNTHIDHDHITGKVRSLLCNNCNSALGMLKEDRSRIDGLSSYVKIHK